ncbi:MAG: acyl-CoA dehydrogenase family protein [Gammaproteobacteria bacterium]
MNATEDSVPNLGPAEDRTTEQARARFQDCARSGFLRHAVPEEYGGFGTSYLRLTECHATLGEKTRDPGLILALNAHLWGVVFPILRFGDDNQKQQWMPDLLSGEIIGGHAITEPQAGSDVQAMQTSATETADGFIINGHKRFITNTPIADVMIVYAKVEDSPSISGFIVKPDDPGASFNDGPAVKGCATAAMGDIILSKCTLPKDRMLGAAGAGGTMIQLALELERAFIFAGITGVMQWQLAQIIKYSRTRVSGDGALSELQDVAYKITGIKLRLDTSRLWIKKCAERMDQGKRITLESAQAKLYASEAFMQSSLDASHLLGAKGLENEFSDFVLDAMAGLLMSGSSEVQKNIIASMLGIGPKKQTLKKSV